MRFFGSIEKTYKDDAGHLIVCGHASTEALDSQGEIVTKEAMGAALTDYMKFANVREMHQPSAVGKTLLAEQDEKGTYIEVKVVDPTAAMKCSEGVYNGFSIGGKASARDPLAKNTITGLRLTEISLVDRPANPEAIFTMFKLDDELGEEAVSTETTVQKGMDHVAQLAYILKALGYMVDDQASESKREGDGSQVPAFLQAWLQQGAEILKTMTAEETAELVAAAGQNLVPETVADEVVAEFLQGDAATQNAVQDAVQMAAATDGLEKKGAKFSKDFIENWVRIKNVLSQNINEMDSLVFPALGTAVDDGQAANFIANPNELAQPEGPRGDQGTPMGSVDTNPDSATFGTTLQTVQPSQGAPGKADVDIDITKGHDDDLAKIATLISEVEKLAADKETLAKRVAELEAEPAPAKAKVLSLGKAEDVVKNTEPSAVEKLRTSKNPVDVMKAIHLSPGNLGYPK